MTGYRKLLVTGICFAVSVILLIAKVIDQNSFVELNKFVIPAFLAANLAEWFGKNQQNKASQDTDE